MIFAIPGYSHAFNSVSLSLTQRPVYGPRGYAISSRKSLGIKGTLISTSVDGVTAMIAALEAAYARGILVGNVGLYEDDGTPTAHVISSTGSLGGIRITQLPSYPVGDGGEYTTYRTFEIQLEADYPNLGAELVAFEDQIQVTGTGGPRFVIQETIAGPPVKQLTNLRTSVRAVQSGSCIGLTRYPDIFVPPPAWPQHELVDERSVGNRGPRMTAGVFSEFGISWQYKFWSAGPLSGRPAAK